MKTLVTRSVLCVLVLISIALALPLFAQTTPPKENKKATVEDPQKVSEEIVVTARKKEETVQDVPMSVAAPTEAELREVDADLLLDAGLVAHDLPRGNAAHRDLTLARSEVLHGETGHVRSDVFDVLRAAIGLASAGRSRISRRGRRRSASAADPVPSVVLDPPLSVRSQCGLNRSTCPQVAAQERPSFCQQSGGAGRRHISRRRMPALRSTPPALPLPAPR